MHSQGIYIKIKPYKRGTGQGGEPVGDTILFGKYELIRTLGRGRCSTVYLAKHLELDEYRQMRRGTLNFGIPFNLGAYLLPRTMSVLRKRR